MAYANVTFAALHLIDRSTEIIPHPTDFLYLALYNRSRSVRIDLPMRDESSLSPFDAVRLAPRYVPGLYMQLLR